MLRVLLLLGEVRHQQLEVPGDPLRQDGGVVGGPLVGSAERVGFLGPRAALARERTGLSRAVKVDGAGGRGRNSSGECGVNPKCPNAAAGSSLSNCGSVHSPTLTTTQE
jgi:hypothetical protein